MIVLGVVYNLPDLVPGDACLSHVYDVFEVKDTR